MPVVLESVGSCADCPRRLPPLRDLCERGRGADAASRKLYAYAFRDESQPTLLEGLACAFVYFDGATARIVLDNMSTAVLGRVGSDGKVLWHSRFLDFTRHYGT
ncbi:MAG TPA: hypothetical protein PLI95_26660, partial [Polyangiaceae bacterium]|nr:hypothetical protein [Polyangiaceae bacterium]